MLLREYEDRWGAKVVLNLEGLMAVVPECTREEWETENLDVPVTLHFGGCCFGTTRKVYLEILNEVNKVECKCKHECKDDVCCESVTPSIFISRVKYVVMKSDYLDANSKMRLLADLDIFM